MSVLAERALIGALLTHPDARSGLEATPADFGDDRCRLVYEAIRDLPQVDFVLVAGELERRGQLARVGTAWLTGCCLYACTSLHVRAYSRLVHEAGQRRRAADALPARHGAAI